MGLPGTPTSGGKIVSSNKRGGILGSASDLLQGRQTQSAKTVPNFTGLNLNTPAFSLGSTGATTTLTPQNTIFQQANQDRFPNFLAGIQQLRESVTPGISAFRRAALGQVESGRSSTVGNLREALSRRGVLGSSFGSDVIARTNAEFAQQRAQVEAQAFQQEFNATLGLIQAENDLILKQLQRELQELQLTAGIGTSTQQLINQNAALRVQAILGDEGVRLGRNKLTLETAKTVASFFSGGLGGGAAGGGFATGSHSGIAS